MEDNKVIETIEVIEMMMNAAVEIKKFCKECESEKLMNEVFERTEAINGGQITIMVEVKDVPVKNLDKIICVESDLHTKMLYCDIPDKANEIIDSKNKEEY